MFREEFKVTVYEAKEKGFADALHDRGFNPPVGDVNLGYAYARGYGEVIQLGKEFCKLSAAEGYSDEGKASRID